MRAPLAGLILLLAAPEAAAGAWPRDPGTAFVATSYTISTGARTLVAAVQDLRSYGSIFAEYGLTGKLTVGLDAGYGTGEDDRLATGLVFVRRPVRTAGDHRVAAEFGVGLLDDGTGGTQTRIRLGLAWGRGFASRWGDGWLGLESWAELRLPSHDTAVKVDATAGLKPNEDWMLILQLQSGHDPGAAPIVRLAPSVVRRFGAASHLQLGLIAPVAGDDAFGLKFATWFSF